MSLHSDPEKGPMDEKLSDTQHVDKSDRPLKFDKTGLPLVPQPSDDPSDPLKCVDSPYARLRCLRWLAHSWPLRTKIGLLLLVSFIASNTPWALAVANPAFREIANYFGYAEPVEGGYPSTVGIVSCLIPVSL